MHLINLLAECDDHVRTELASMPEVIDVTSFDPAVDSPPITARRSIGPPRGRGALQHHRFGAARQWLRLRPGRGRLGATGVAPVT
jgi:hypothetical protein